MSDCCDVFGFFCCCCLCSTGAGGAWCNSSPNGKCRLCCGSRPHDDVDLEGLEDIAGFNEQFNAQYDPSHNAIYNETPDGVGHRTVQTQPMGNHGMMTQTRALGGDAPFATRPPTDQLPAYSSRPPSTVTAGGNSHRRGESHTQDRMSRPPSTLTPGGGNSHRRGESHPQDRMSRPPSTLTPGGGNSHRRGESHPEDRLSRPPPALTAGNHRRQRSHSPNPPW